MRDHSPPFPKEATGRLAKLVEFVARLLTPVKERAEADTASDAKLGFAADGGADRAFAAVAAPTDSVRFAHDARATQYCRHCRNRTGCVLPGAGVSCTRDAARAS